jgi:hypothetical protein
MDDFFKKSWPADPPDTPSLIVMIVNVVLNIANFSAS